MVRRRIWARLAAAVFVSCAGLGAQAQTPLNPPLTPPNFRTTITVRLFCGKPDCPEQVYDTRWITNELGDVYASDSGILYPFNKELGVAQFPIPLRQYAVPGTNVTGVVGSSFRGDILTAWYDMHASGTHANFKMRIRFHPYSRNCEILSWEYWGRSGGMPLVRAFVRGTCVVERPT